MSISAKPKLTRTQRRVSFSEPDRPSRTPSPVIINLGEIHMSSCGRSSLINSTSITCGPGEYGSGHTRVNAAAGSKGNFHSHSQSAWKDASDTLLAEMTAALTLRERALELTEARYAGAVRRAQELEKELFELKNSTEKAGEQALQNPVPVQQGTQSMFIPPSPSAHESPMALPPFQLLGSQAFFPTATPLAGYRTIYVDVDFVVDQAGGVIPLQVRPRNAQP